MSGNRGDFRTRTQEQTNSSFQEMQKQTEYRDYESSICQRLNGLLREYNERDAETTTKRLEHIKGLLADYLEESISLRFGGSVSRHTYVDGISDVDCLLLLKQDKFSSESPQDLLKEFEKVIKDALGSKAKVDRGDLSIKVTYKGEPELQILPSLKTASGYKIAERGGEGWSQVIHPDKLAKSLTDVNQKQGRMVIPTIKLVKAALENIEINPKIKGCHLDALAVKIFQNYVGELNPKATVQHFVDKASDMISTPIRDQTGQSDYLDDDLGPKNSRMRQSIGKVLKELSNRLKQADADCSITDWMREIET